MKKWERKVQMVPQLTIFGLYNGAKAILYLVEIILQIMNFDLFLASYTILSPDAEQ